MLTWVVNLLLATIEIAIEIFDTFIDFFFFFLMIQRQ